MNNIVNLFSEELKNVGYIENGDVGVATLDRHLHIYPLNKSEFEIVTTQHSFVLPRDVLAEFLHVASVFVDSEDRFKPKVNELVGYNYE